MSKPGWIRLWRSSQDNELYFSEPFTKWQAWLDLLILTNHKSSKIYVRGNLVSIERGQVAASEEFLAARWKWSRGKVRRFVGMLKTRQQIVQQKSNIITIYTVCNYKHYQPDDTADSTTDGRQTDGRRTTLKNVENVDNEKNGINKPSASGDAVQGVIPDCIITKKKRRLSGERLQQFKSFWDTFNYKKGKAEAADSWLEIAGLNPQTFELILSSAASEAKGRPEKQRAGKTPIMAQRWLSGRRWEDDYSDPEPEYRSVIT